MRFQCCREHMKHVTPFERLQCYFWSQFKKKNWKLRHHASRSYFPFESLSAMPPGLRTPVEASEAPPPPAYVDGAPAVGGQTHC